MPPTHERVAGRATFIQLICGHIHLRGIVLGLRISILALVHLVQADALVLLLFSDDGAQFFDYVKQVGQSEFGHVQQLQTDLERRGIVVGQAVQSVDVLLNVRLA